jgi:hypothetical protein
MKTDNNIAIIRESLSTGLNHTIAKTCEYIINDLTNCQYPVTITDPSSLLELKFFNEVTHIIMIVSEWNGSFPYTFKKMVDDSGWPSALKEKQIMLIGTSQTPFGNPFGLEDSSNFISYY